MGAVFQLMTVPASYSRKAVEKKFIEEQERDRYDNGHSYSGGFGMATGLKFTDHLFSSEEDAEEWLVNNCKKWEEAIAVTAEGNWVIGAWCSS